jgi:metal-responsive CopG/Arc/MetJ family transcriptional regulator
MADAPTKKRGRPATGRDPLISARIPQEAIDALEAIAARDGETRSKLVRRAILEWLESQRGRTGRAKQ